MPIFINEEYILKKLNKIKFNIDIENSIKCAIDKIDSKKKQKICEILDDVVIDVSFCDQDTYRDLRYGYPFTLFTKTTDISHKNCKVAVSLTGPTIRKKQYSSLICKLKSSFELKSSSISSENFKKISSKELKKPWDEFLYVDPYRFIGDSFIGLVCADALMKKKGVPVKKFTHNKELRVTPFMSVDPIDYIKSYASSKCIVMPNFIDDQLDHTYFLINAALSNDYDVLLLVPGRNLIIKKQNNIIEIFKLADEEFILWKKSKEEMLYDALQVFDLEVEYQCHASKKTDRVLINPLTSKVTKDFNPELTNELFKKLGGRLITGFGSRITTDLKNEQILAPQNISELIHAIEDSDFICTADTAVGHIANRLNKVCVVIYNSLNWDGDSIVSSIHNSSMGFSSRKQNFLPLICNFENCNYEKLADLISALRNIIKFSWDTETIKLVNTLSKEHATSVKSSEGFEHLNSSLLNQFSKQFPDIQYLNEFYYDYYQHSSICLNDFVYRVQIERVGPIHKLGFIIAN